MTNSREYQQIVFPLRQPDSTSQSDANYLLARPVFEALHKLIEERLNELDASVDKRLRHSAVLVNGNRGTGKSSVLVNLELYLKQHDEKKLGAVLVLKPIDPTLLEDHDDLFLNIVVAAVLSDERVKGALEQNSEGRTALYKQLHHLGHALESMQTQREKKGIDKIRAFIGNQELIEQVHKFFASVLKLLNKKLLVMPIDDVDTSLHRAFENLEVVRRYLTSSIILPVISGDAGLYHDVTWRDFHGRLINDSKSQRQAAESKARELASEYHRKVLPLQFRLAMPTMREYLANDNIILRDAKGKHITFPQFNALLEALLNDRVNGVENSYLPVPVSTVRAFSQLVYRLRDLIPQLAETIDKHKFDTKSIRHHLLMPDLPIEAIDAFRTNYLAAAATGTEDSRRNSREAAYTEFTKKFGDGITPPPANLVLDRTSINKWIDALQQHFKYDPDAGAAYLVLLAGSDWSAGTHASDQAWKSMFDTALFQPQRQQQREYTEFNQGGDLEEWRKTLSGRAPETWLKNLPDHTILPYPVPEVGPLVSANAMKSYAVAEMKAETRLLTELLLHRNFYMRNKTGVLLCVGRIFEIVMTSLLRDVTAIDIASILNRPPFYSFGAIAKTKTLESAGADEDDQADVDPFELDDEIAHLADAINRWREDAKVNALRLSPWLTYNVMNKFFSQAWNFNNPASPINQSSDAHVHMAWQARKAFNSLWAAFGSFEKGALYGLPPIIATVNVGNGADFSRSDLYRQNITPFVGALATPFGKRVGAITTMLESHPLKAIADGLLPPKPPTGATTRGAASAANTAADKIKLSEWLHSKTGKRQVLTAASVMSKMPTPQSTSILEEYMQQFGNTKLLDAYINAMGL